MTRQNFLIRQENVDIYVDVLFYIRLLSAYVW